MRGRHQTVIRCVVLIALLVACSPAASKGTMPPPDPDGQVDPSRAPDFIAVAGPDGGIAGWVPKGYLFDLPATPEPADMPVYADDLRTVIGHMVAGVGFVPLGVDPATIPKIPVVAGPSLPAGRWGGADLRLYVRNATPAIWVAVQVGTVFGDSGGFVGGLGMACYDLPDDGVVVQLDRSLAEPGAQVLRPIAAGATGDHWVDVAADGTLTEGAGIPDWWTGGGC